MTTDPLFLSQQEQRISCCHLNLKIMCSFSLCADDTFIEIFTCFIVLFYYTYIHFWAGYSNHYQGFTILDVPVEIL